MAKGGILARFGGAKSGRIVGKAAAKGKGSQTAGDSARSGSNPLVDLVIADIVLRGGGKLLHHVVEHKVLKTGKTGQPGDVAQGAGKAGGKAGGKGRGLARMLIGTAVARIATRSVPGAILVGGGLLAKTLYDRRKGAKAEEKGKRAVARQAAKGS